jgi:hypothetical protein
MRNRSKRLYNIDLSTNDPTSKCNTEPNPFKSKYIIDTFNDTPSIQTDSMNPPQARLPTRLEILDVASMSLTGTLSTMVGLLTGLQQLRVSRNQMTGTIPTEIALLTGLQLFWSHINKMVGSMPTQICSLVSPIGLQYLQTDCHPEGAPAVECLCCSACCDRNTSVCLTLE